MRRFLRIPETTLLVILLAIAALPARAEERLRVSTTTSTENSGLLAVLLPPFEKKFGCKVDVVSVGTGKALKLGEAGDPAGVGKTSGAPDAFRAIAAKGSPFISRGDESGTHQKEKEIWASAGIAPRGAWYLEAGQGMGEVIMMATQKRGYTLSDRGTYIAFRKKTDLAVLQQGEKNLRNPYGIIAVSPKRHPHVKYDLAMKLIEFVTGPEGQSLIAGFKVDGEPLFFVHGEGAQH